MKRILAILLLAVFLVGCETTRYAGYDTLGESMIRQSQPAIVVDRLGSTVSGKVDIVSINGQAVPSLPKTRVKGKTLLPLPEGDCQATIVGSFRIGEEIRILEGVVSFQPQDGLSYAPMGGYKLDQNVAIFWIQDLQDRVVSKHTPASLLKVASSEQFDTQDIWDEFYTFGEEKKLAHNCDPISILASNQQYDYEDDLSDSQD